MTDLQIISAALSKSEHSRIVVLGDYALDKYLYIDPKRDEPSLETGLTAYQIHGKRMSAGAGGNVVSNLRALGAQVTCISLVGDDGEGYELLRCLKAIGANRLHGTRLKSVHLYLYQAYAAPERWQLGRNEPSGFP